MTTDLESLYRDLHAHPELGFAEHRTAGIVAQLMTSLGLEVTTGVGGTGVVAVVRNGEGAVVYLRADMDGLPVREDTGLDYASTDTAITEDGAEVPLMHACGHDVHVTCLIGAVEYLMARRSEWSGTLVAVFQPAEETIAGAKAMVADGLAERFPRPTVVLGQHVAPFPAGLVAIRAGTAMAGADSIDITFTGRGGHGSRPQTTIDPIVAASAAVMRLQTIVSREVEPGRLAVVSVGSFHAGSKGNIIPTTATLGLSVRSVDADSRDRMLDSITRIAKAEAQASGMTVAPTIVNVERAEATINAVPETERLQRRFAAEYGEAAMIDVGTASGSEDVGEIAKATGAPLVFWFLGGCDPQAFAAATAAGTVESDIPSNHSPHFAPVIRPTIERGVSHLTVAALEWLSEGKREPVTNG